MRRKRLKERTNNGISPSLKEKESFIRRRKLTESI